jgi:hypothetical protein
VHATAIAFSKSTTIFIFAGAITYPGLGNAGLSCVREQREKGVVKLSGFMPAASFSLHRSTNLTVEAASRLSSCVADCGRGMFGCMLAMPTWSLDSMKGAGLDGNIVVRMSRDVGTVICVRRRPALTFTHVAACWFAPRMAEDGLLCDALVDRRFVTKLDRSTAVPGLVIVAGDINTELCTLFAAASKSCKSSLSISCNGAQPNGGEPVLINAGHRKHRRESEFANASVALNLCCWSGVMIKGHTGTNGGPPAYHFCIPAPSTVMITVSLSVLHQVCGGGSVFLIVWEGLEYV